MYVVPKTDAIRLKACATSAAPYYIIRQGVFPQAPQLSKNLATLLTKSRVEGGRVSSQSINPARTQQKMFSIFGEGQSFLIKTKQGLFFYESQSQSHTGSTLASLENQFNELTSLLVRFMNLSTAKTTCSAWNSSFFSFKERYYDFRMSALLKGTLCSERSCRSRRQTSLMFLKSVQRSISASCSKEVTTDFPKMSFGYIYMLQPLNCPFSISQSRNAKDFSCSFRFIRQYTCSRHSLRSSFQSSRLLNYFRFKVRSSELQYFVTSKFSTEALWSFAR